MQRALLLASAEAVLQKREDAKPRKKQSRVDVVGEELAGEQLVAARKARGEFLTTSVKRTLAVRYAMPTSAAEEVVVAASTAVDVLPADDEGGVCAFTSTRCTKRWRIVGNTPEPMTESTHCFPARPWGNWVEACVVVLNFTEWMDQWVGAQVTDSPLTAAKLDELVTQAESHFTAFHLAEKVVCKFTPL